MLHIDIDWAPIDCHSYKDAVNSVVIMFSYVAKTFCFMHLRKKKIKWVQIRRM
jgi:hypothetical protein